MENQIVVSNKFNLTPTTLKEALEYADILSKSDLVPSAYRGKPQNILVAVQMGAELGLGPLQSLQNIAVINGRPSIYGDSLMALVLKHPDCEDIQEIIEDDIAICRIKRRGHEWYEYRFSVSDAKKANLWGRPGPWTNYPQRMLQQRARGFALRDKFADALNGLITEEEAQDYPNGNGNHVKEVKVVELLSEEHLRKIREFIEESQSDEEVVVATMSSKFNVHHEDSERLENFPDSCFEALSNLLKKKIQMNKELDQKRSLLNSG